MRGQFVGKRFFFLGLAAVLCTATVAGCGDKTGEAAPAPVSNPSDPRGPSSTADANGKGKAPKVVSPLDAGKYVADPCLSLTSEQTQKFGAKEPGAPNVGATGNKACSWNSGANGDVRIDITYLSSVKTGLSNLYALNESGQWDRGYFEPGEVDGYPSALASVNDARPTGACVQHIGVSDELMVQTSVAAGAGDDSCKAATNVAEAVIDTIKRGA